MLNDLERELLETAFNWLSLHEDDSKRPYKWVSRVGIYDNSQKKGNMVFFPKTPYRNMK